ncbi:MAG: hypothetical protein PHW76_10155, partial [Alphaproteobacteria bacterium]|nr:hypothetical protein [Alphaproteobacteria bacterium]
MAKILNFTLLLFLAWPARAMEMDCQALPDPEIVVNQYFEEPQFDHSIPMETLKAISMKEQNLTDFQRAFLENARARIGGLTAQKPAVRNSVTINIRTDSEGTSCVQITKVKIDVSITNSIVRIAREFPEGSCSYQAVLAHELKHVAMARRFLYEVAPIARDYVKKFLERYGAVKVGSDPSGQKANEIITWSLNQYINGYTTDIMNNFSTRSGQIDTPEEYKSIAQSCNGETQRIFNSVYGTSKAR